MTHKLYLIVGPSGTGKSTLARRLAAQGVPEIVSHTSRSPRDGELDGVHYYFVSVASFEAMIFNDSLVEHVTYGSHHYGTTRLSVATALEQGPACVVVEAGGAVQLKTALGSMAVTLVLAPPPLDDLRRRMLARGDNPETIEKRLSTVGTEAAAARRLADYVLAPAPSEKLLAEALKIIDGR